MKKSLTDLLPIEDLVEIRRWRVFWAYVEHGYTIAQIAQHIGRSKRTVIPYFGMCSWQMNRRFIEAKIIDSPKFGRGCIELKAQYLYMDDSEKKFMVENFSVEAAVKRYRERCWN